MMATAKKKAPAKKAAPKAAPAAKVHSLADLDKLPLGSSLAAPCHGSHPGTARTWGQ